MLEKASRLKRISGLSVSLLLLLTFLSLIDLMVAGLRGTGDSLNLLPGRTVRVNGMIPGRESPGTSALRYDSNAPALRLSFDSMGRDYWFGGNMWLGALTVSSDAQPGEYRLRVFSASGGSPTSIFNIKVFENYECWRRASGSLLVRILGIPPGTVAVGILPLILIGGVFIFCLSVRMELEMAKEGRAEIYHIVPREKGVEVCFGLGLAHGVKPGMELSLASERKKTPGLLIVLDAAETDSRGIVDESIDVRCGDVVSIRSPYYYE